MSSSPTAESVLTELRGLGREKTAAIYRRHGVRGEVFGVSYADLKALAKRLGRDQALADGLWATENADARTLATMIAAAKTIPAATLEAWVQDAGQHVLADAVAGVAAASPHALACCEAWRASEDELVGRAGWTLVALLAGKDKGKLDDAWFRARLEEVAAGLQAAPNRKREAMHGALMAIGGRSDALQAPALEVARALGPVEIDHGETACKTPDAIEMIEKMAARRAARS